MASGNQLASVDLCAMRVAQLHSDGSIKAGAFGFVTTSITQAKIGTTNDTVNEVIRRNGCGTIVTTVAAQTLVKGSAFSVDLTVWDRELLQLMCGGTVLRKAGAASGYKSPKLLDGQSDPCCIELWSKSWNGSTQAISPASTPSASWHRWVLPEVFCYISTQFTLTTGDTIFTINGDGVENPNISADGPFSDWPAWVSGTGGINSAFGEFDDNTVPVASTALATVAAGS
jgi:hypothetical protein